MLCAKSLTRRYFRDTRHANCFYPVRDVSLELRPGEVVVLTGRSGSGKTRRLYDELIRDAAAHPEKQYFAIVPEQFTMQTQKDIVDLHPNHGVMNIDIVSFERLAYRIFEELAVPALSVLDDMGKAMVIRRTAGFRMSRPETGRNASTASRSTIGSLILKIRNGGIWQRVLRKQSQFI